jgi:hypothetical protein
MVALWDHINDCTVEFEKWQCQRWTEIDAKVMDEDIKNMMKKLKDGKCDKK